MARAKLMSFKVAAMVASSVLIMVRTEVMVAVSVTLTDGRLRADARVLSQRQTAGWGHVWGGVDPRDKGHGKHSDILLHRTVRRTVR